QARPQLMTLCLEALALNLLPSMATSPNSRSPISAATISIWVNSSSKGSKNRLQNVQIVIVVGTGVGGHIPGRDRLEACGLDLAGRERARGVAIKQQCPRLPRVIGVRTATA